MKTKNLEEIIGNLNQINFNRKFDLIIGIARGGIMPAQIVSQRLKVEVKIIKIKYRDDNNDIIYPLPKLEKSLDFDIKNKSLLLVDDVSRSGATLEIAKQYLAEAKSVTTLVINGPADYFLYNEECFKMPWK